MSFWYRLSMFMISMVMLFSFNIFAAQEEIKPLVGKKAAQKYFDRDAKRKKTLKSLDSLGEETRYFNVHLGGFTDSTSYVWGEQGRIKGLGRGNYGVTYLLGSWTEGMDVSLRVEFISYELEEKNLLKMGLMPLITFPRFHTGFPVYLGFGIGPGVFFKQLSGSSNLSLDYQLVVGARFINMLGILGFFVEAGLKNHLHILSQGQFNGVFTSGGLIFTF